MNKLFNLEKVREFYKLQQTSETDNQKKVANLLTQILENTSGLSHQFIEIAQREFNILVNEDLTIRVPGEVLAHVFSFLPQDNRSLCSVNKRFRAIAEVPGLRDDYFMVRLKQLRTLFKKAGLAGERLDAHVRLIKKLPRSFKALQQLTVLSLKGNLLTAIPKEVKNIERLYLERNQI